MFKEILSNISPGTTLGGVARGSEALLLSSIRAHSKKDLLCVTANDREMETLAASLSFFDPAARVLTFPAWDCLPYDRSAPNAAITAKRLQTLTELAGQNATESRIILTTVSAMTQKLPPRAAMAKAGLFARVGQQLSRDALMEYLIKRGYSRLGKAMEPGEFAVRGSIIDIIPPGSELGVRLDFFGDTLESIRMFEPLSQVSQAKSDTLSLLPISEVTLDEASIERFRTGYREHFGAVTREDPLYESISEGRHFIGMEHWLPLFYDHLESLVDYLPGATVLLPQDFDQLLQERDALIQDYYEARRTIPKQAGGGAIYHPLSPDALYLKEAQWNALSRTLDLLYYTHFIPDSAQANTRNAGLKPSRNFSDLRNTPGANLFEGFKTYLQQKRTEGRSILIACFSEGSAERMQSMLSEHGIHVMRVNNYKNAFEISGKTVGICVLPLEHGFESDALVLLSEQDLLGERILRTVRKKKKSENFLAEASSFSEGELVVHKEHGIGRFEGLITVTVNSIAHDCLKLVYEGEDKLFLPVENIEMVSRYGTEDETSKLDKLGAGNWQARKARLRERIKIAAEELMKTAAERAIRTVDALDTPTGLYEEFSARFPYMETEDQARSIDDVMSDLGSGRPMDRLICGDVGFGKTEVALRAAFIATHSATNPVQVAVIAPTTLLARQHYKTFSTRFDGLPVNVRQLSRLVGSKESKETKEKLAEGKVDIIVGTHALLAKDIAFKNLGLLIIDEEQHFGVGQKEKLKALKSNVHVLTLSATPIPRTLQLALSGVRELSLITTPPVDRLAIRTFVMPFDPVVAREALMREYHRGGKSFCVVPRIKDIAEMKENLSQIVPELKLCVAHGQLAPTQLDKIMNEFYDGKYDILLSTAIIESGIDIPTANTIIIHKADRFGLAQLYQLRGRVGRSKTRAYAYFTLPHHKQLSKQATRRLEVMQTLDTLGAGFSLASHDMDIRGFGNLVGEEQSGHVREVGIELYQQMLEEAVAAAKRGEREAVAITDDGWSPQINLGMNVLIPERYVSDLDLRLGLYRRAATLANDAEVESFAAELVDRFGSLPEEVEHLLSVMRIKLLCKEAGVERIDAGPKGAVLSFRNNQFANPEKLLEFITRNAKILKLRADHKLVVMQEWSDVPQKISGLKDSLSKIIQLAA